VRVTDAWLDRLSDQLGVDALSADERSRVLAVARDVAHGVERRITPLATFLLGAAVAKRASEGSSFEDALRSGVDAVRSLIPESEPDALP
jgi:Domain of unknown function (DUF6457)